MAKTEVSAQQVQMAAAAGVELLANKDLPVPLGVAKSGALGILEGMLTAIANGEVVLASPQPENNLGNAGEAPIAPVETPNAGANDAGSASDPSAEA
jgi:hypothetical protein